MIRSQYTHTPSLIQRKTAILRMLASSRLYILRDSSCIIIKQCRNFKTFFLYTNLISSDSKINALKVEVLPSDHREDEVTCLVFGPSQQKTRKTWNPKVAGSSPRCATIFLPRMFACWHSHLHR